MEMTVASASVRMFDRLRQLRDRVVDAIEEVERESLIAQAKHPSHQLDTDVIGVTILACVVLAAIEFWGGSSDWPWAARLMDHYDETWGQAIRDFFRQGDYARLRRLAYWSLSTFVGYMLLPMLWTKMVMGRSLRGMGLSTRGVVSHAWLYVGMYLLILPAVYAVSGTESFQSTYPFYEQAGRSYYDLILWETMYAIQFMSLEFFFRGFLIHGLKRRFGFYAIFVSVIPYCMIHFGKPIPECFGSIIAGLALGMFSLFTGSIWLGVLIHVSVAVTMDMLAL